ncbi:hypothetical protein M6B38_267595 [Iris pallida]|uniref:Uncharacterized protein n=1 Tax=Iris pallida TaxID=29817 RepID=A0AAX6I8L3_IRIPA|nr:hypothetical protein M6B38_267595 [Iris pallida]
MRTFPVMESLPLSVKKSFLSRVRCSFKK